jgi:hypothetical protein
MLSSSAAHDADQNATSAAHSPQRLPVRTTEYQVVGEPRPVADVPSYYSAAAYHALPGDHGKPGVTLLDGDSYAEAIRSALRSAPAGTTDRARR